MITKNDDQKAYICDRRDLLKWCAAGSALAIFPDFGELYAAGAVDYFPGNKAPASDLKSGTGLIFHWIDGASANHLDGCGLALKRMRLAVLIDLPHAKSSYVEAVLITDRYRNIIARQTFVAEQATSTGRAPYAIFDNMLLSPDPADKYYVYFVVTTPEGSIIYQKPLVPTGTAAALGAQVGSRADYKHLEGSVLADHIPAAIAADMAAGGQHLLTDTKNGMGFFTTPFQTFAGPPHDVRFKVRGISSNGDFSFEIAKMHGDTATDAHYMRYFLVLDPVGRVLGGLRRKFGLSAVDTAALSHTITRKLDGEGFAECTKGFKTSQLNISDCPYVQIITEDSADALARVTFRLR